MRDRLAGFLGQPEGRLVCFLGGEVGSVDELGVFAHRVLNQLLGAVQGGEGDAHAGQDAQQLAVSRVGGAALGLADPLWVEPGKIGDLALRQAPRHPQGGERLSQELRFLDLLGGLGGSAHGWSSGGGAAVVVGATP